MIRGNIVILSLLLMQGVIFIASRNLKLSLEFSFFHRWIFPILLCLCNKRDTSMKPGI